MTDDQKNCIFCKIIKKEIPAWVIYEDDKFIGFLDINPVAKGHSLLIPKEHHAWIHETPDELLSEAFIISKKIIKIMRKNLSCDYVQVNVTGTDVPHLHVHLIPRWLDDGLPRFENLTYKNEEEKEEMMKKIKNTD